MAETEETLHFLDYWRVIRSRKEIIIAIFLLVVLTGMLVTYSMPKVYRASTVIQVKEETPDVTVFSPQMQRFDPLFLRTQFEIIQSRPVLEEVVRRLGLDEKLAKAYGYVHLTGQEIFDQTLRILSRRMKVQQYRDTNLIEIQIDLAEPRETVLQDVSDTANAIVEVFRIQTMTRSRDAIERALKSIFEQLEEQRKKVAEAEAEVEAIRQEYKIDLGPLGGAGSGASLEKISLQQLETTRIRLQSEFEEKKARYDKVMSLTPESLLEAAPILAPDQDLSRLVTEKSKAEVELSMLLKQGIGVSHPDAVRLQGAVKELKLKIDERLRGLKTGFEVDYDAAKNKMQTIEADIERKRQTERSNESDGYRKFDKANEEWERAKRIRDTLEARYLQERIELRIPRTTVEVIAPAKPPDRKDNVSPDLVVNVILSVLVGLCAGLGLAYFIEYLDTSVKTIEDIERFMRLPVVGVIPQKARALIEEGSNPAHAEAYRLLRTNIQFSKKFVDGKALCVTSGSVGEGKSLTIFNLGFVCAQLGDRVLLVDSDLYRPRQHKILGVSHSCGLANVLVGEVPLWDAVIHTRVPNLDFLPSGRLTSGVHGLLDTRRMKDLLLEIRSKYDLVLFDAPPMIGVSDASLLVREMDGVILVVQHRKYPKSISNRAKEMIENLSGNIVGVVLNNINVARDYSYHYYQYHHAYYYPNHGKETTKS